MHDWSLYFEDNNLNELQEMGNELEEERYTKDLLTSFNQAVPLLKILKFLKDNLTKN